MASSANNTCVHMCGILHYIYRFPQKFAKLSFGNDNYSPVIVHHPTTIHDKYITKCCTDQIITTNMLGIILFVQLSEPIQTKQVTH